MVRRARFVFVALFAVLMLGAATASLASAAEMTLPEFKNAEDATSTSTKGQLKVEGGAAVKCEKNTGKYLFLPSNKRLGTFTLDFHECSQGGEPCVSLGDSETLILVTGEWHLVLEIKSGATPEHLWLILFLLPNDPHIECPKSAVKLLLVLGDILTLIVNPKKAATEFEIIAEAPGGVQKETAFENNKAEQVKAKLEVSQEGGKQKAAGLESEKNILTFLVTNEILN